MKKLIIALVALGIIAQAQTHEDKVCRMSLQNMTLKSMTYGLAVGFWMGPTPEACNEIYGMYNATGFVLEDCTSMMNAEVSSGKTTQAKMDESISKITTMRKQAKSYIRLCDSARRY